MVRARSISIRSATLIVGIVAIGIVVAAAWHWSQRPPRARLGAVAIGAVALGNLLRRRVLVRDSAFFQLSDSIIVGGIVAYWKRHLELGS